MDSGLGAVFLVAVVCAGWYVFWNLLTKPTREEEIEEAKKRGKDVAGEAIEQADKNRNPLDSSEKVVVESREPPEEPLDDGGGNNASDGGGGNGGGNGGE